MKDLCIPVPGFGYNQSAEIILKIGGNEQRIDFRLESFPWKSEKDEVHGDDEVSISLFRIERLKKAIKEYDSDWELIQIFTPAGDAENIQVLYRKK
ncbi:MAG: hypothetical protein H6538_08060 [Bacteroidales bacterium]|nr:hypothetical protein [Bacteroidales bacterium]MCB9000152.1 hypothetical protein [Bacteroidales bacterium]MCB9013509.1 hypothetical protein [Bacteroidales bacterium]